MSTLFSDNIIEHQRVLGQLHQLEDDVKRAADIMASCLMQGGKLMFCGNGGSAADSQHLASELTGRFIKDRRPLAAMALTTDTSALTCIGNDYSFEDVFVRQVQGLGRPGDCLVGISTSGNSGNVIRAVEAARQQGMHTIGLLGREGGQLRTLNDVSVIVPSQTTARIQEMHMLIGHTLCGLIEDIMQLA